MENTKKVAANAATAFIANGDLRLSDHFKLREFTLSGEQYATTLTTRLRLWR